MPTAGPSSHKKSGVGAGGLVVLFIALLTVAGLFIASHPRLEWSWHLPSWLGKHAPEASPAVMVEPAAVISLPPAEPIVQRDPYEEVSSSHLRLNDYSLLDVRLRLMPERTAADVDNLLRAKIKSLRTTSDVVVLSLFAAESDTTASDAPQAVYFAYEAGKVPYNDARLEHASQIEPGIYRYLRP